MRGDMFFGGKRNIHPACYLAVLAVILCLSLTGCGEPPQINVRLPREADLSEAEAYAEEHMEEIGAICAEFRSFYPVTKIYFGGYYSKYPGEWNMYNSETGEAELITEDDGTYGDFVRSLSGNSVTEIRVWNSDVKLFTAGGKILQSDSQPAEVENPFDHTISHLDELNWKKTVDGDKITFIADHRLEFESYWKLMYYRVDMIYVGDGVYVYEIQDKAPLYSYFVE